MADPLDDSFIQAINQNLGIAHKICRMYFMDTEDREDVLQEMLYNMWKSYPNFGGRSKFSTWMYSVCLNTAFTYIRKRKKEKHELLSTTHQQIPDASGENKEEAFKMLSEAIAMLTPVNKAIVLLYLENMSYEEIANVTGLSKSNVSVRLVRIKKELEVEIKKKIKSIEDVNF